MPATPKSATVAYLPQHQGQINIDNVHKSRKFICAHRGWWKSTYVVEKAIDHILTTGDDVGFYAPTHKHLEKNYDLIKKVVGKDKEDWFNKSEHTFTIPTKTPAFIRFFSLQEPDNARGWDFTLGIGDEMGEWDDNIWDSVVEPCMKKVQGDFIGVGTPNTRNPHNDFYDALMDAERSPDTHASFIIPARGATLNNEELKCWTHPNKEFSNPQAPFISDEDLYASYGRSRRKARWRIEYCCHFLSDDAGQFDPDDVDHACIIIPRQINQYASSGSGEWISPGYTEGHNQGWFQTGIDVGLTHDFTVISVIDRTTNCMVYFHRFLPGSSKDWGRVYSAIQKAHQWFPGEIRVDCTGSGSHLVAEMPQIGVPLTEWGGGSDHMKFTSANKAPILDNFATLLTNTVKLFNLEPIRTELNTCQRVVKQNDTVAIGAPKGDNHWDDCVSSIALSVMGVFPAVEAYTELDLSIYKGKRSWWNEETKDW